MGYDNLVLTVNAVSVIILLMLTLLLCFATRSRGESSYAALIIVLSTVPAAAGNIFRSLGLHEAALLLAPVAFAADLALMPLLWSLVHRAFDPRYRFTPWSLLHFLPALLMLVLFGASISALPPEQRNGFVHHATTGGGTRLGTARILVLLLQLVGYLYVIFSYLHKVKHYIREHYSEPELARKVWVPRFVTLFAAVFVAVVVCDSFWPHTDAWLLQLLTVIIMGYLLYAELDTALTVRHHPLPAPEEMAEAEEEFIATEVHTPPQAEAGNSKADMGQLALYARQVAEYLESSEAYTNPNLSLKDVAKATGLSSKNLSRAINAILEKSFFDLVNGLRVEKSKGLLLAKKERGYTLDTIAEECGFNSRFTFNAAFKRATGLTTSEWLKSTKAV